MQTYGIFGLTFNTATIKTDKDNGRVVDFKWAFAEGVRAERRFTLEHIPTLRGAAQDGGRLRLEVTPRIDGTHLPSVDVPAVLRGNITIDSDGSVVCTTRVTMSDLEHTGLSVDLVVNSSTCLECTVSNQPTLAEQTEAQIQQELQKNRVLDGQDPLFAEQPGEDEPAPAPTSPDALLAQLGFGQLSQLLQVIGRDPGEWSDPTRSNEEDAAEWRALLAQHWDQVEAEVRALLGVDAPAAEGHSPVDAGPVPPRVVIEPKQPGEDLPFPIDGQSPAAD